ncbi:MAG TPA: hypothetical protein VMO00_09555, partial [Methylomirabilota bacterium]|nr:hypothetical protein [Methylomirabilota bacterium]
MPDAILEFTIAVLFTMVAVVAQAQTTGSSIEEGRIVVAQSNNQNAFPKAPESWSKKEMKRAGDELTAAANDVELGLVWVRHEWGTTTAAVIKDARTVAAKVTADIGWTRNEVSKGFDASWREVKELGEQI